MTLLPSGWDTTDMEILTTTAREYLATIVSNRERNKQQREIAKSENASKNKKDNKKTTTNPKKDQDSPPPNLELHQKEILKEIEQGRHTAARIAHWKGQTTPDTCYYH
eukprot:15330101-Ditylum_brightwellii.AAC.1